MSSIDVARAEAWPELPLAPWQDTLATLHRWTQIVGKTRLALAPFQNHWWHVTLYLTARGLTTSPMPAGDRTLEIEFDFLEHVLIAGTSDGRTVALPLEPVSVATFYARYREMLDRLGVAVRMVPRPCELPDALPFTQDRVHAAYNADAAQRCWRALAQADRALKEFRGRFLGKSSPSHFWWGAFDLSCTRFSGRRAPLHPGGFPNLPDRVTREAYSHECISAGWWPGTPGGPVAEPAFYAYAYPEPAGCSDAAVRPATGGYHPALREWVLPYETVRRSPDPHAAALEFFQSTYEAAASLGGWNRAELERPAG
ncbi:MAG TPA: DUF5996 family protein [Candidatus Eisenbacteria bacterium]|nr:DUF5996 family protein [Candidatus Eisenbacteria bacterium]